MLPQRSYSSIKQPYKRCKCFVDGYIGYKIVKKITQRVPWTARRLNQSILREINSEYSLEGLMLKLKVQYFGHLMRRTDSLEKTLMLGKIEGKKEKGAAEDEMVR